MKLLIFRYPRDRITDILLSLLLVFVITLIIQHDSHSRSVPVVFLTDHIVEFLNDYGVEVNGENCVADEVILNDDNEAVFFEYNRIQKMQGFNLLSYIGKSVNRYTFPVENCQDYNSDGNLYATVLVFEGTIIAADIHSVELNGFIQGVKN